MTFPHIDPDFKLNANLPDHLQPDYIQRVFYVNNAVMETSIACKCPNTDCLECGNAECFMIFEAQAELQGMTLTELMEGWRKQRELDGKAADEQAKRFAEYQRRFEELQNRKSIKKVKYSDKQTSLFNLEKAA